MERSSPCLQGNRLFNRQPWLRWWSWSSRLRVKIPAPPTFPAPPRPLPHGEGQFLEVDVDGWPPRQRGEPLGLRQAGLCLLAVALHRRLLLASGGGSSGGGGGGGGPRADQLVHAEEHGPGVQHEVGGAVGVLEVRHRESCSGREASSADSI